MDERIRKEIRFLKAYALISTLLFGVLIVVAAKNPGNTTKFDEIDVQRINIREKDGRLRLAISNNERFPGGSMSGVELKSRESKRGAGLLFFNDDGDEDGGLVYSGKTVDGKIDAGGTLRFDHYKQQEAIGITYSQNGQEKESALQVWDQPNAPITAESMREYESIQPMKDGPEKTEALKKLRTKYASELGGFTERVFVGRTPKDEAAVLLMDTKGKPRIRMAVNASNVASLQFLDENGKVVFSLPNPAPSTR